MKDPRVSRLNWPRGRITSVHPGGDGIVRVVDIQTAKGVFRRPIAEVVPLLLQKKEEDPAVLSSGGQDVST